jgi:beta-glucosidase
VPFGKQPFTGKLSHTWPASAAQEPINVGHSDYQAAFRTAGAAQELALRTG